MIPASRLAWNRRLYNLCVLYRRLQIVLSKDFLDFKQVPMSCTAVYGMSNSESPLVSHLSIGIF